MFESATHELKCLKCEAKYIYLPLNCRYFAPEMRKVTKVGFGVRSGVIAMSVPDHVI